jgi:hypothetical protein
MHARAPNPASASILLSNCTHWSVREKCTLALGGDRAKSTLAPQIRQASCFLIYTQKCTLAPQIQQASCFLIYTQRSDRAKCTPAPQLFLALHSADRSGKMHARAPTLSCFTLSGAIGQNARSILAAIGQNARSRPESSTLALARRSGKMHARAPNPA